MADPKNNNTTAGVYMKANPYFNFHEQMIILLNNKQGQTESDDYYLSRVNSRLENMNLAGGAHVLCSSQIIGKYLSQCTTAATNTNKERFKAMCFVLREDESCYGDLLYELRKGVNYSREVYPNTVSDDYDVLMRT